ncbi:PREDICTED: glutaminyl-peptide cyclotransferase-like [Camelina sativa]|uniref:Glutaminyl-peptide cyclotransferase-like n=1 Tax=Camelina sativa TaxID=90675 RepID=A0ABM0TZC5_CAMSA|nr:PREDICTED: glutaminyl-peptide cyclotransferase-like [Camelina sativa]
MATTRSLHKRQTKRSMMIQSLPASHRFISRKRVAVMMVPLALFSGLVFLFFMPFNSWGQQPSASLDLSHRIHEIEVVAEFPHDPDAFTQGLLYAGNDTLFESTGLYGKSSLRKVSLRTGKVEVLEKMKDSYFGEGLTLLGERLFQVAWLTNTGFTYDLGNLRKVKPFRHHMKDGWGLATDGEVLFGSDGTSTLYRMDPQTMKVSEKFTVRYNGREVRYLNELEYINKEVWANVWQSDCIARISPKDGSLLGWILLPKLRQGLLRSGHGGIDVLNGIAWDSEKQRLFVTGKLWPKLYQIKLKPASAKSGKYLERQCLV